MLDFVMDVHELELGTTVSKTFLSFCSKTRNLLLQESRWTLDICLLDLEHSITQRPRNTLQKYLEKLHLHSEVHVLAATRKSAWFLLREHHHFQFKCNLLLFFHRHMLKRPDQVAMHFELLLLSFTKYCFSVQFLTSKWERTSWKFIYLYIRCYWAMSFNEQLIMTCSYFLLYRNKTWNRHKFVMDRQNSILVSSHLGLFHLVRRFE